jgi:hypothetical protein
MKFWFLVFLLFFCGTLGAQDIIFFSSEKPIKATLTSDFAKMFRSKSKLGYQPAELSYFNEDSILITNSVEIKTRGKNRLENCYYPPLKISFKGANKQGKRADGFSLKMVVECNHNLKSRAYLFKEYLCYKMYSALTDTSFKVRLLELEYIDTGKKNTTRAAYAFFIENEKDLAKRVQMILEKRENLTQKSINHFNIMRLAMFQFMIGNFDWAVPTQQNLLLVRDTLRITEIFAIPYDFDYCGLVNADYAIPAEALGIRTVSERIYLGECRPREEFDPIIQYFESKRQVLFQVISDFDLLSENEKRQMYKYLEQFYDIIRAKGFYNNVILANCKKIKSGR